MIRSTFRKSVYICTFVARKRAIGCPVFFMALGCQIVRFLMG